MIKKDKSNNIKKVQPLQCNLRPVQTKETKIHDIKIDTSNNIKKIQPLPSNLRPTPTKQTEVNDTKN